MLTSRRFLLRMSAGAAIGVCAPAIVRAEITPQEFGATGGDAAADTAAWNRAVKQASDMGRPVMASGTYVLRAPAASNWNWWKRPSASTHVAVQLHSHTHVYAKNARILVGRPEVVPSNKDERHFLFGTGQNLEASTLRDIVFDGLTFDFREEFGAVHSFTYAIGMTGVDGFTRRNLAILSSGAQAGRGLLSENTRNRTDSGLKHTNIVQGIYTRYENGVAMRDIAFDRFNEALDFDGPCWDVTLSDMQFRNGFREAQCIDTGGGARWDISNVAAENTGPLLVIYIKPNAWPTYREWLESGERHTSNYVPPEHFVARKVRGINVGRDQKEGRKGEALRIGTYRSQHWSKRNPAAGPGPKDITIEDWNLSGGSQIAVNDCENLKMQNIVMSDTWTPVDAEAGAALVLRESEVATGGKVTGTVSDVHIRNSNGMGVSVVAGVGLSLKDVTVNGFNLGRSTVTNSGIRVRPRRGVAGTAGVEGAVVSGGGASAINLDR